MPKYRSKKNQGEVIEIPDDIALEDGRSITFSREKSLGWSVGGWYKDERNDEEFMVKFEGPFSYIEKMFNDLAVVAVGEEYGIDKIFIGHGLLEGRMQACFVIGKIKGYSDLDAIKDAKGNEWLDERKKHAKKFHPFYVFNALISNDDLNEENLGLTDGKAKVIDYGMMPRFFHPEQAEFSNIPFTLASFIGHRNLNGMQLVRRRYFGHDSFLLPEGFWPEMFSSKLKSENIREEDISYGSILDGVKKIIENKDKIIKTIEESLKNLASDPFIIDATKERFATQYAPLAKIMGERINWMAENFAEDLAKIDTHKEEFDKMKWRLMPKFSELMEGENKVFKQCAQTDFDKDFDKISQILGRDRTEILTSRLDDDKKEAIRKIAGENFMLHNAIIAGDFGMAKWLAVNDLVDVNSNRTTRNHNYQHFRLTPLHMAIAIYHDKLHYGSDTKELKSLEGMINVLKDKFFEKNGGSEENYKTNNQDNPDFTPNFPVLLTFRAFNQFEQKAQPATKIQAAKNILMERAVKLEQQDNTGKEI